MKKLVNLRTVPPNELQSGDVMVTTVTCHISRGPDGNVTYRLYRCPYPLGPATYEGIPQGMRIGDEEAVATQLFPVVRSAKGIPDCY